MSEGYVDKAVELAAKYLASSSFAIALTGAGVSAESGIPTFRGKGGLWERYDPEEVATAEALRRNPELVWKLHVELMKIAFSARPNPAHAALAELEEVGVLKCVVTQNIDDLHRVAGSKCVVELHGNIKWVRCTSCTYRAKVKKPPEEVPPKCPVCGSLLRPDVVFFGEPLPESALRKAYDLCVKADVMLVVGTSAVVMPAGMLPHVVKEGGGRVIEVNLEPSAISPIADITILGKAGEVMPKIVAHVKKLLNR